VTPLSVNGGGDVIDTVVYPQWASSDELLEYVEPGWREYALSGRRTAQLLPARPTLNPSGERQRLGASGGLASDLPRGSAESVGAYLAGQRVMRALLAPAPILWSATIRNHFYAQAMITAANEWMRERWLSGADQRIYGTLVVSNQLVEAAVEDIRRFGKVDRFVAVAMVGSGLGKLYGHPVYHPLYRAAAELRLPLVLHVGGDLSAHQPPGPQGGVPSTFVENYILRTQLVIQHLCSLICQGVFEEMKELRVLVTGAGANWLPSFLWRMDEEFRSLGARDMPWLKSLPSDYVRSHVMVSTYGVPGCAFTEPMVRAVKTVGWAGEVLSFGSGYPNWDMSMRTGVEGALPGDWLSPVMRENAEAFFRW
jgi:predicted TIM-barrel fold metal-dependent hydrolase